MRITKEVQEFLIASEHLYQYLEKGKSLGSHEAEIVSCCVDELLAKGACRNSTSSPCTREDDDPRMHMTLITSWCR